MATVIDKKKKGKTWFLPSRSSQSTVGNIIMTKCDEYCKRNMHQML